MAYEKKLCILKQIGKGFTADGMPLMGAVYAERLGSELTITPRIAGLAPLKEGRYALAVLVGRKEYCLELKGNTALRVPDCPSLEGGFAVLLCFVSREAEPVAFGSCGSAQSDYTALLDAFRSLPERERRARTQRPAPEERKAAAKAPAQTPEEEPAEGAEAGGEHIPPLPMPPTGAPGLPGPNTPFAPGVPLPGEEPAPERGIAPDGTAAREAQYDDEALAGKNYYASPEPPAPEPQEAALTYYESIRPRLEEAFRTGRADSRLCRALPHSEWVLSEGALLGIIYRAGQPRYVCLAVEAEGEPPAELEGKGVFVPVSPYSDDEGFFVVFQDAATGEFVK